ncbi:MAG: NifB/NifX family molybdenum-iron cluster-binding protein [Geobacter sp.]
MTICFPVVAAQGLESIINEHFGSSRQFVIVDSASGQLQTIDNRDHAHQHGACNPVGALGGHSIDAIVVGGIGAGAVAKLQQYGIKVFKAQAATVGENLTLLASGSFNQTLTASCGGHHHGHSCGH